MIGDLEAIPPHAEAAERLARTIEDHGILAHALLDLGAVEWKAGHQRRANENYREALACHRLGMSCVMLRDVIEVEASAWKPCGCGSPDLVRPRLRRRLTPGRARAMQGLGTG